MTAACLLVRSPACSARQLQTSIVQVVHLCPTGFRKEPCERLERHKPKGLRVVLRGLGSSNAPRLPGGGGGDVTSLPDAGVGNHPGLPGPEFPASCVHFYRSGRESRYPGAEFGRKTLLLSCVSFPICRVTNWRAPGKIPQPPQRIEL